MSAQDTAARKVRWFVIWLRKTSNVRAAEMSGTKDHPPRAACSGTRKLALAESHDIQANIDALGYIIHALSNRTLGTSWPTL